MEHDRLPHLTALEHESIPITSDGSASSLSVAEAEALLQIADTRRGFCERSYRSVRLAQHCGVVNLGNRVLEILPKVGPDDDAADGRSVLLRLVRASAIHEAFEIVPAAQRMERASLLEIFIAAFMDAATEIVRGGLLRRYSEHEDDLRIVRGRVMSARQFGTLFNRPDLVAVRYDEHTADNLWNRLVKAALRACRPWIVSSGLHRRWVELVASFDEVADVAPAAAVLDRLAFDRQAARYRRVIEWVRWILSLLSPSMRAGDTRAPSFLFDMNHVFEVAVANLLERRLAGDRTGVSVEAQKMGRHLARLSGNGGRPVYGLKPDLMVREGGAIRIIADAKWKHVEITPVGYLKPPRADVYQMQAYASAFGVDRLALIYPAHRGVSLAQPTEFTLPASGAGAPTLSVVCVGVHSDDLRILSGERALYLGGAPSPPA